MTDPTTDPVAFLQEVQLNYLNALAIESANPKPTYSLDGQNVSWDEYRASLLKTIEGINALIVMFDPREIRSVAI
jgi:hypothetical protein